MGYKNRPNLGKSWLSRPIQLSPSRVPESRHETEGGPPLRTTTGAAALAVLEEDRPPLRELLQSNKYHLALVSRDEADEIGPFEAEPPAAPASPVLLPFKWKELVARVCEFVRDANFFGESQVAWLEDACIDFTNREVRRSSGELVALTNQEFKTLKCFLLNPDRVLSRDELLNQAWGYENYPSTRTVDNHVLRLRQKFERDPARPVHFRTVHRVGYKFVP